MPRIRTIKPDFWTDEKVGKLKRDERLLFIGLWNIADDQGVVKSNSGYIKGQLFSYDEDLRVNTVDTWLASLTKARLLIPFDHNGQGYYLIRTFNEHQLINRPSKPKFSEQLIKNLLNDTHGILTEYSLPEKEGNGYIVKEGKGSANGANVSFFLENDEKHKNKAGPPGDFSAEISLYWQRWKDFKAKEFGFLYKSEVSEKASVEKLFRLSNGNPSTAKQLICSAIENGWKSFYSEKNSKEDKKEEIKNKSPDELKTDVQFVYELLLEGREVSKLIEPVYFDFLQLTFDQDIKTEAWKKRINQLTGSNHAAINKLREAYETYDPENKLVGEDKQKFDDLAKRIAVFNHFKKLQEQGKEALFYVE